MPTTWLLREQLVGSKLLRHSSEKPLGFLPMVRLNQRRWQVSVLSASANHNVVSLELTCWWSGYGHARNRVLFRISILKPSHKYMVCYYAKAYDGKDKHPSAKLVSYATGGSYLVHMHRNTINPCGCCQTRTNRYLELLHSLRTECFHSTLLR